VLPSTERRGMSRRALLVFVAVLVTGALTVGEADGTSAGKFRVVIEESGSVSSFQGRFALYAPMSTDSGTSALQVQISPVRYRSGQRYEIHSGVDTMHGKKGGLKLTFSGPSVNAGPSLYIEYGTWRISSASGVYKGWKGGGNWGGTDNEQTYHLQWEGLITR
jgi:hypothetical protein